MTEMQTLYDSLSGRPRPEDLAKSMLVVLGEVGPHPVLQQISHLGQYASRWHGVSSMATEFEKPVGADRHLANVVAQAKRALGKDVVAPDPDDILSINAFLGRLGSPIGWRPLEVRSHKTHRLTRPQSRLWRALDHAYEKVGTLRRTQAISRAVTIGRIGFVQEISFEDFSEDPVAASFVAYVAARKNQRRQFTLDGRKGAVDQIAAGLLDLAKHRPSTRWDVIAHISPSPQVLIHLGDLDRGRLLGRWGEEMRTAARILSQLEAENPGISERMAVRRGDDSTNWNAAATWYNGARANWISCLKVAGALDLLEAMCPPKALRVMAADLMRWHQSAGGGEHGDSAVARDLPKPWIVLEGKAECPAILVRKVCIEHGIDPETSGWISVRQGGDPPATEPTPELVHGVSVSDPLVASLLRGEGMWAGPSKTKGKEIDPMIALIGLESRDDGAEGPARW